MSHLLLAVKVLASISAIYMCFSPLADIRRIHCTKSTGTTSIVPLVALLGCNHMWMLYGYVSNDYFPLLTTYAVGDFSSLLFIATFYRHSQKRVQVRKLFFLTLVCLAIGTTYAILGVKLQTQEQVTQVIGVMAIASSIILYASPLSAIKRVIREKNSASIPFAMVMIGAVNNALWIVYGFLISDLLIVIPCCINVTLGVFQLVLYVYFHPKRQQNSAGLPVQLTPKTLEVSSPGVSLEGANFVSLQSPSVGNPAAPNDTESTTFSVTITA